MVYVMNHGYQDGISLIGSLNAMSKDAFKKPLDKIGKELTFTEQLYADFSKPYYQAVQGFKLLATPMQRNCIRKDKPAVRNIVYSFSKPEQEIVLSDFKKQCKSHKVTVTTASQALFGMALKEYFREHGDSLTDTLTFASQYSLMP